MSRIVSFFAFLILFFDAFSQEIQVPELGFRYIIPTDATDFSDELVLGDEISYSCFFSLPTKYEGEKFSLAFTASADGHFQSVLHVKQYELEIVKMLSPEANIVNENDSFFVYNASFMGIDHTIYKFISFSNNISYVRTVFMPKSLKPHSIDTNLSFNQIDYFKPVINYSSISDLINKTPEDATLWHQRAKRKFNYHDYIGSIEDCNVALDLFGMYGEVYYLQAQSFFIIGDTVNACRGYVASIEYNYNGEAEFSRYCDTPEMQEAMESHTSPVLNFGPDFNHLEIADSLKQFDYFYISSNEEPNEKLKKYSNYLYHMSFLNFQQLDSLYQHGNDVIKLSSYIFIRHKFPESISKSHKAIFKNNNELKFIDGETTILKVKDIANLFEERVKSSDNKVDNKIVKKAEKAISKFIKQNSLFSDSYKSLSFEVINVYKVRGENEFEAIGLRHQYELENLEGVMLKCSHVFKMNSDFRITLIEENSSSTVSIDPPRIQDWLKVFGKPIKNK